MQKLRRVEIKKLYKKRANKYNIAFLCNSFENAVNVGHVFRIAESLGAKVLLEGRSKTPNNNKFIETTSKGTEKKVVWQYFENEKVSLEYLKDQEYEIISIELSKKAIPLCKFKTSTKKVCFILGAENNGVSEYLLKNSDDQVYIPQFGKGFSLNTAMSGAIVSYFLINN